MALGHQSMTGERIDPLRLMPAAYRPRRPPEPELTGEAAARETERALRLMQIYFTGR